MLRNRSMWAGLAAALLLAAGCEETAKTDSNPRRDRDGDGISDPYDRRPNKDDSLRRPDPRDDDVVGRDPDRVPNRTGDRVADRRGLSEIPRDAVKVEEGVGQSLRYEAERDGRIYVYDEDDDKVVYSGNLYRGEQFIADPKSDVLSAGGKRLGDVNLRAAHGYRLYFMRE